MPGGRVRVVAAVCVTLLAAAAFLHAGTQTSKPSAGLSPQFAVQIEQNGALVPHVKHEVPLKRAPFTIILDSPDLDGAYLNASFQPDLFDIASLGLPFGNRLRTTLTVAEKHKNPDQELFPGLDSLHYLDYRDKSYVRMDQVTPVGAGFRGRRTVAGLYFDDKSHPIAEVPDRHLYLVIARGKAHPDTGAIFTSDYEYLRLTFEAKPPHEEQFPAPRINFADSTSIPKPGAVATPQSAPVAAPQSAGQSATDQPQLAHTDVRAALDHGAREPKKEHGLVLDEKWTTHASTTGFSVKLYTPLAWLRQLSAAAALQGRKLDIATLEPSELLAVVRVLIYPDTPRFYGKGTDATTGQLMSTSVKSVAIQNVAGTTIIEPVVAKPFPIPVTKAKGWKGLPSGEVLFTYQGLAAVFAVDALKQVRGAAGTDEFVINVTGETGETKQFVVKRKHFQRLI